MNSKACTWAYSWAEKSPIDHARNLEASRFISLLMTFSLCTFISRVVWFLWWMITDWKMDVIDGMGVINCMRFEELMLNGWILCFVCFWVAFMGWVYRILELTLVFMFTERLHAFSQQSYQQKSKFFQLTMCFLSSCLQIYEPHSRFELFACPFS